jgi:hypothetical protein
MTEITDRHNTMIASVLAHEDDTEPAPRTSTRVKQPTATGEILATAALLCLHADRAGVQAPAPWRVVITDSESLTGVASCAADHTGKPLDACDDCYVIETYDEAVAGFMAAVDPAAGTLMADLLERVAEMDGPAALLAALALSRSLTGGGS